MLSVIIPTHESERLVVRTLACLVSGATAGLVREVILADAGSHDETERVAEVAGCRFFSMPGPAGVRLKAAARQARGPWLLFLPPGAVLDSGWIADVECFLMSAGDDNAPRAAAFRPNANDAQSLSGQLRQLLRLLIGGGPKPDHGLLLTKTTYDLLDGHSDGGDPQARLIRKIGRRKITVLRAGISSDFG